MLTLFKLGYIPPTPLEPQKILKTLQNLNTLIAIRLNLHEDLIPQLRDYRIANGRVTFAFPAEFELDVSISSEDPATPFFFLDVRFLFSPAPQISSGPLRDQIEFKLNVILAEHGLRGACDFIHSFILTHKIGVLRQQAIALSRGIWALSVRVEMLHRTLVVQYWAESPQAKSWLEIGIGSGKRKGVRNVHDNAITPIIKIKWMQNGKDATDVDLPLDLENLSVERILKTAVAMHISSILRSIRDNLMSLPTANTLAVELASSDSEPLDCSLRVRLGEYPAFTLAIDPITGRLFFSPASASSINAQHELERMPDPAANAHLTLAKYVCYDVHQRIEKQALYAGWTPVRNFSIKPDIVKLATKTDVQRYNMFRCAGWGLSSWVVAYTVTLAGESWWAIELLVLPCSHLHFRIMLTFI
jgi:mediator of RNA polymerase II transcription subunit 14